MKHWNSDDGTVCECGGTVMVEECGGTVLWNSVVYRWNSDSGTVLVEQCCATVLWNSGTVWWNSGTVMVEQ